MTGPLLAVVREEADATAQQKSTEEISGASLLNS